MSKVTLSVCMTLPEILSNSRSMLWNSWSLVGVWHLNYEVRFRRRSYFGLKSVHHIACMRLLSWFKLNWVKVDSWFDEDSFLMRLCPLTHLNLSSSNPMSRINITLSHDCQFFCYWPDTCVAFQVTWANMRLQTPLVVESGGVSSTVVKMAVLAKCSQLWSDVWHALTVMSCLCVEH